MRFASPNELRTIVREDLGFYNAVVIGGVYEWADPTFEISTGKSFIKPLKHCVDMHPLLSVIVKEKDTEKAYYERVPVIDLRNHVSIMKNSSMRDIQATDDTSIIEKVLPSIVNDPWLPTLPPWRIVVVPLPSSPTTKPTRCFIAFQYSHALGDGMNGLAFHRTFLDAVQERVDEAVAAHNTPDVDLNPPFDTPQRLTISWSFLLLPLLAVLLPKWVSKLFGLWASASTANSGTWTGSTMFFEPGKFEDRFRLLEIGPSEVENALIQGRRHGAKLTSVMHQLILRALSGAVPQSEVTNFVSLTAVNMRRACGISNDEMGLYVNVHYESHDRVDANASLTKESWAAARCMTDDLARRGVTLHNQPIGLLRYAPSIRKWTAAKIGQERDGSYEVSNILSFSNARTDKESTSGSKITKMVFAHSANPISSPLIFSTVSVTGGSLMMAIAWQKGAFGIPEDSEESFMDGICASIKDGFKHLGTMTPGSG